MVGQKILYMIFIFFKIMQDIEVQVYVVVNLEIYRVNINVME